MSWLLTAIISYLILAIVFLLDKYLLENRIPDPGLYAFYTGLLSISIFLLVPFVDFVIPSFQDFLLAFFVGIIFVFALFWFYKALHLFEASRVVPTVGAMAPFFSLLFIFIFTKGEETLSSFQIPAFLMLILGSFLISYQGAKKISFRTFLFSSLAAVFFALFFVLQKNVFGAIQHFWASLIWMSTGSFFAALCFFLFSGKIREEVCVKRNTFCKKTAFIFFLSKILAAAGGLLQRRAIFLITDFIEVSIVQGLQGVQYAFLFVLALFFSWKFPKILEEKISKKIIVQKSLAIILIGIGLAILTFFKK